MSQSTLQAVVTPQAEMLPNSSSVQLALFNSDGTAYDPDVTVGAEINELRELSDEEFMLNLEGSFVSLSSDQTIEGKKTFGPDGKLEFNGGGFTPNYDTDLWIAGRRRINPTINSQGLYIQHRVEGDLGGFVHDAGASELRMNGVSNTGAGQSAHEDSLVITGGVNDINLLTASLANFHTSGTPTGVVDDLALFRATQAPPLPPSFSVAQAASMYLEQQIIGSTNYTLWAADGDSVLGILRPKDVNTIGLTIKGRGSQSADLFQVRNSADSVLFTLSAAGTGRFGAQIGDGSSGLLTINANLATAATIALRLKARSDQTGDMFQVLKSDNAKLASIDAVGNIRAIGTAIQARNGTDTGTIVSLGSTGFRWNDATMEQTTIGAAGGASALPATPTKFLKVRDSANTLLVIPAYAAT